MSAQDGRRTLRGSLRASARFVSVGLALLAIQLDFFSLNLAIPRIAAELHVPPTDLQWLLSGYMLSFGAFFIPAGKIGDTIGRKRTIVAGLILFGAMSLACGLTTDPPMLIGFRVAQGVGASLILPNAFALVGASTNARDRSGVLGVMLTISGVGTALGPVIGGIFTASIGWRWLFLLNIPIAVVGILTSRWLPEYFVGEHRGSLRGIDWPGTVLVATGIGLLCVGIDDVTTFGPGSPLSWAPFALGAILLVSFGRHVRRARAPLVRPSLFTDRGFMLMAFAGSALNLSVSVVVFTATLQVQTIDGYPALPAGLAFLGSSIGLALAGPAAGWAAGAFGARRTLGVVLPIAVIATAVLPLATAFPIYVPLLGVAGFAGGLGWAVAQIGAQQYLPAEQSGEGAALISTLMVVSGGIAVVIAGVVIESVAGTQPTQASLNAVLWGLAAVLALTTLAVLAGLSPRQHDTPAVIRAAPRRTSQR